jgi:hypothetical protein
MPGNRLGKETTPYLLQHKDNPVLRAQRISILPLS